MISKHHRLSMLLGRLWRSKNSSRPTVHLDSDSDSDDEVVGNSATMGEQTDAMQNPLSIPDRCVSLGSHEKSKDRWHDWKPHHQRKRIKMFLERVAEKGGLATKKGILVTTRIEVVSTPVPSPTLQNGTFRRQHTVNSMDFITGDGPASPRSVSRLMMSTPSFYAADAQAGAERGNLRRHSVPFTSSLRFPKLTNAVSRSRARSHNDGGTSVLGLEAEWTQCLERPMVRCSVSCGTLESVEKGFGMAGGDGLEGKGRGSWRDGGRCLGLFGIGRRMRRLGKVL